MTQRVQQPIRTLLKHFSLSKGKWVFGLDGCVADVSATQPSSQNSYTNMHMYKNNSGAGSTENNSQEPREVLFSKSAIAYGTHSDISFVSLITNVHIKTAY